MNINSMLSLFAQQDDNVSAAAPAGASEAMPTRADWEWTEWNGSYWFPEEASSFVQWVDPLYDVILWVSAAFFVLIIGTMTWFVYKYRKRPGYVQQSSPSHNMPLELAWTILPSLILVYFFVAGVWGFMDMRRPPVDSEPYTIRVNASQWAWQFVYPNGEISEELHIPQNTPVRFVMSSRDVLHSLYVPAFRQKWDVVPGRYTQTWVRATEPGTYRLYCTEYCGNDHSNMDTIVIVHEEPWDEMMKKIAWKYEEHTPIENGERLWRVQGCASCHSIDGAAKTGPTFLAQFGIERDTDAGTVVMDETYIRESILEPNAKIRGGYPKPSPMPTYQGRLTNDEVDYLIEFIKSLNAS